jgi:hypothetical protein
MVQMLLVSSVLTVLEDYARTTTDLCFDLSVQQFVGSKCLAQERIATLNAAIQSSAVIAVDAWVQNT